MNRTPSSLLAFRAQFPSLTRFSWLDTPGCPPGARPVLDAVRSAVDAWERGEFSWIEWDDTPELARAKIARLLGVESSLVALVSSLSEAAATVAGAVPDGGSVVVGSNEFRSNLLPWLAAAARGVRIVAPVEGSAQTTTERICASIVEGVDLVAVSSALSSTGVRPDLEVISDRARAVGAQLFLNVTQSFGVLRLDLARIAPDYVAAHAYKWMLAPRGCAWLYARADRLAALEPVAPGWHSVDRPNQDYNGIRALSTEARRLDGGLPWLPWIGGNAALDVLATLDGGQAETHVLRLARRAREGLEELGVVLEGTDRASHIVRMYSPRSQQILAKLRQNGVVASGNSHGLRIGIHAFNIDSDIERFLDGVKGIVGRE
ncbi:MAG: aminotransferase class V-fold PLP-dependent enzyme [Microbacteriaceae bacterium]|nr:MAG: aminotransferase class V-fold PLP-dependent enzyme [Microbacteriaceae bacterium]